MRIGPQPVASAAIIAGLGYTPANRAGDTFTGAVTVQSQLQAGSGGNGTFAAGSGGAYLGVSTSLRWSSTSNPTGPSDLFLVRHAAGWLGLANSTTAQSLSVFKTRTDVSNWQGIQIDAGASRGGRIITNWTGTGTAFDLVLGAGQDHWMITQTGHWLAVTDNSWDIGQNGANRPRDVFAVRLFDVSSGGEFRFASRARIFSPADQQIEFTGNGGLGTGAAIRMTEMTDPAAPPADKAFLYVRDSGGGKTQLVVRFPTGAIQVIATEP